MNIEEIKFWITLGLGAIGVITSLFQWIKRIVILAKSKKWDELKSLLTSELIPINGASGKRFNGCGRRKENWVIKKLSDKVHIDFFKYTNVLTLAKEIIADICKTTKIDVNKTIIIEEKEKESEVKNVILS